MRGSTTNPWIVTVLLLVLALWDAILSYLTLARPGQWFQIFHDSNYVDPQGLLRRTGAVWVAFTLLQLLAAWRWQRSLYWLPIVAGVRWTELFSDWTYVAVASEMTTRGKAGLLLAPPINLLLGLYFMKRFQAMQAGRGAHVPRPVAEPLGPRGHHAGIAG